MKISARFLLIPAVLALFFFLPENLSAQTATDQDLSKPNQNWQCLNTERLSGHTVRLSANTTNQFPPPGSAVYIVECISTKAGAKCTTGQCEADTELIGNCNDLRYLESTHQYKRVKFTGSQPLISNIEGKVGPVDWESQTKQNTVHTFFGVGLTSPITLGDGSWPTLQLGTFYFPNSSDTCEESSMRWDPYGRIFDSVSLEPLPGVNVTLNKNENNIISPINLPGLTNPQLTDSTGIFNFVVPDGTYRLNPVKSGYSFPNVASRLNSNYNHIYSDIYRGEDIVQAGFIQHRDIPMDPSGTPFTTPVKILDYIITLDKKNSRLIIKGTVSHPFAKVGVYSESEFIKQVSANNFGYFTVSLDNASIDHSKQITINSIKTDLTDPVSMNSLTLFQLLTSPVFAQEESVTVTMDTILNYVDGYAFDGTGYPVPEALVSVYLESSDKPFYQTRADSIGYFTIPSQNLPPLSYIIQVESPDGTVTRHTSTSFSQHNARYASAASVNFGVYRPQVPGTDRTIENADNVITTTDGRIARKVIGPDGNTIAVTDDGEIIDQPESEQIITADNTLTDSNFADEPQEETLLAGEKNSGILSMVIISVLIFILILLALYFKNKKAPLYPSKK